MPSPAPTDPPSPASGTLVEHLVDIGGFRLALCVAGHGSPTVVLEAGSGDGATSWGGIVPAIAAVTQVCTYDRAGVGHSDPSPHPRTGPHMIHELHKLLQLASVRPPYVLVGHSLGGLLMQLYAVTFPDQVAAMVLVDPAFPELLARLTTESTPAQWAHYLDFLSHPPPDREVISLAALDALSRDVGNAALPDVPLLVLSSDDFGDWFSWPSATVTTWFQQGHAALVGRTRQGRQVIVAHSQHTIHQTHPTAVIDAITQAVAAARS